MTVALAAYDFCRSNRCGNFGTDSRGSTGCLKLGKPCSLLDRLYVRVECPVGFFRVVETAGEPPRVERAD